MKVKQLMLFHLDFQKAFDEIFPWRLQARVMSHGVDGFIISLQENLLTG